MVIALSLCQDFVTVQTAVMLTQHLCAHTVKREERDCACTLELTRSLTAVARDCHAALAAT